MTGPNGHAKSVLAPPPVPATVPIVSQVVPHFSPEKINELIAALEVPFDSWQIEWRVMNTTKSGRLRGQVIPYADQRAYTDRLNALLSPAGWTRKYSIHTSANFERGKDQKIVAKVLVTCELTIFGLGSHSATGEQWADDPNAGTAAEAQAFKRAASCFGLGRYLYYFTGTWVDLDDRKRPKSVPQLVGWATPEGWTNGLRPTCVLQRSAEDNSRRSVQSQRSHSTADMDEDIVGEIERLQVVVGNRMYRGLLKTVARVWNPREIKDRGTQEKVLKHLQAAERGLARVQTARAKTDPEVFRSILRSWNLSSLDQVDNLNTLQQIVSALEAHDESDGQIP
jgi:hypothetical protein